MPGYALRAEPQHAVQDPLWRALQAADAPRSVAELHLATNAHPNAIQHRLSRWGLAGFVTRTEGRPLRFAMTDNALNLPLPPKVDIAGRITPRPRPQRDRLWSAMRVLRTFDLPQLMIASDGASRRSAEDFVNCLQRAGFLRQEKRGNSMTGEWSRYRLVRNSGRRTPRITHRVVDGQRRREVFDPNTGERHDISPGRINLRSSASPAAANGGVG